MTDAVAAARFGPQPALAQLLALTRRQAAASLLLAALAVAGALYWQEYDVLALFAALLLAAAVALAGARLLQAALPRAAGWSWCWALQPVLLLAGAAAGSQAYVLASGWLGGLALSAGQMFGAALAFCVLVLSLPLGVAQRQARALEISELQRAALSAELKSLQAQVEPHFLYNTLANTRYLARHDPERAVRMLDHLIAYLRSALPDLRTPDSTLGRECELAGHYLALMEIRFGERLRTHIDCPEALRALPMPPLMLMSLVENAVRHGLEPKPGQVCISVAASVEHGQLNVVVRDDGAGLQQAEGAAVLGSGVGLRNVRQRLQALYHGRAAFVLRQAADGATEASLLLPLEPA